MIREAAIENQGQTLYLPPMPSLRLFTKMALAWGLAVVMAVASKAQDIIPPPGSSTESGSPGSPPQLSEQPNPGIPTPEPNAGLPPAAEPVFPESPPGTALPGPNPGGGTNAGPPGDTMGFDDMGGGMGGGLAGFAAGRFPTDSVRYSAIWFPNVPVLGQATHSQTIAQDLSFTHPLWTDPLNYLGLLGGVRNQLIETGAILPQTGQPIPSDLWNVHFGLQYVRQLGDGWLAGGGVSVESASDHPFANLQEMNAGLNAMLRIPQGEHNAWMLGLMYSPTGELNFPIPMVAYSWNPSPEFHANIGLPLMVIWRPSEDWQFQASYMLIHTIHVKLRYRLADRWSVFAAYDWSSEAYTLLDRPEENDRFFLYDQRVSLGLQTSLLRPWTASLSAGYVFDRYMFEGTSFASTSSNRVDLGNGPFTSLSLGVRF
jgi:hypothetical protein